MEGCLLQNLTREPPLACSDFCDLVSKIAKGSYDKLLVVTVRDLLSSKF